MQEFLDDPNVWFTLSFVIFAGVIYKYGIPALNKMLDGRIAKIIEDLHEAENLRIEAQEMLAQYQRKHRDALDESKKILDTARENAEQYRVTVEAELEDTIARREQQLEDRMKRMEQNAITEIQGYAADLAMNAAKEIIAKKLDKSTNAKLVEEAIVNVERNIH